MHFVCWIYLSFNFTIKLHVCSVNVNEIYSKYNHFTCLWEHLMCWKIIKVFIFITVILIGMQLSFRKPSSNGCGAVDHGQAASQTNNLDVFIGTQRPNLSKHLLCSWQIDSWIIRHSSSMGPTTVWSNCTVNN